MKCHLNSNVDENRKYENEMEWKRSFHKINNTKLVESYSYYGTDGDLIEKLVQICKENEIAMKPINTKTLFNHIYKNKKEQSYTNFVKLVSSFITLFKANGYTEKQFLVYNSQILNIKSKYEKQRIELFISIVKSIYLKYEKYLNNNNMIDFSDMIIKSTDYVKSNRKILSYKYVIIDEYQDIGFDKFRLVQAILKQTGAKLMCVGDDWQSIYRFSGSDISLFTKFEYYWGKSEIMRIQKTYRNSQELIDIAGKFIMTNNQQIKKSLISNKTCADPIHAIYTSEKISFDDAVKKALDSIIDYNGRYSDVILLGRTKYDLDKLVGKDGKKSSFFKITNTLEKGIRIIYSEAPNMKIRFLTVHKSKGIEADNIIMLNVRDDLLGFPNKISDDPLLKYVLSDDENYLYSEERRLFYVALTRTKNRVFMILNPNKESMFYFEIEDKVKGNRKEDEENILCPKCRNGQLVERINKETKNKFYGCSNYPYCNYTSDISSKSVYNKSVNINKIIEHDEDLINEAYLDKLISTTKDYK